MLGQWVMAGRLKLASTEFEQCAKSKNWIPASICEDVMSRQDEAALSRDALEKLGTKYSTDLQVLKVATPYLMKSADAIVAGQELPACP